ncbi:TonB-dependent receptor [Niabella sp.]|uniref:TonB-dependent receptor n=1 Tax=Niabella sp. TaxID=1962976 RepID=UPI00261E3B28|nr:TonB-dependent receptor [Niabella sp.]
MLRLNWLLCILFFCLGLDSFGQAGSYTVKGQVTDIATGELLVGATLQLNHEKSATQLDGRFAFRNIPQGTYTLSCDYMGYKHRDTTIILNGDMVLALSLSNHSSVLSEVVVQGSGNAESDAYARRLEKNAAGVINTVSANAILQSPDVTIAGVLQRVSGVSLERSTSGEGRYAIIRGMDQRYNYTLINGIKIPSPDNKYRYVPMDIFPSDLVERVEVHKTLTPDMEADAVGGVVNMVMKNAPSNGLYLKASVSGGLNQNLLDKGYDQFSVNAMNKQSPFRLNGPAYIATPDDFTRNNYKYQHTNAPLNSLATLAIGNRFLANKLGVMLGLSYQNLYKGYSSLYSPAEPLNTDGSFVVKHVNVRDYSSHLTRTGGSLKLDYAMNANNTISLYELYANLTEAQVRITNDTIITPPRTDFGNGQVWHFGRSKYQEQQIYNTTLQGEHRLSQAFSLDWSAVYSKANNKMPDFGEYEYDGGIKPDGTAMLDIIQKFQREWWLNSDRDLAGYLNLHYASKIGELPYTISAGGLYRDKQRANDYDGYTLGPVFIDGAQQVWSGIDHFQWTVITPQGSPASANNYTAYEKIKAGYAMAKLGIDRLEVVAGVRMENTSQGYNTNLPETIEGKTASYNYSNILPSANLKYLLTSKSNLRFVYFSAINRPGFFEPVPYGIQGDDFSEHGNYNVKHATAQNLDLRYELYMPRNGQLLLGAFYKYIQDPIEYGFAFTGNQASVAYQPGNYGNASNYGVELVFEKYIGKFGLRGNYTYTNSSISSSKRQPYKDENTQAQIRILNEKRPLQGQSAHLANAALLYKNTNAGTEIQFNWQFTGRRIALVSPYYGMDYWMKDMQVFDASAEQKLVKHLYLFAKVQNLFNAKYEVYINKQPSNINIMPFQNIAGGKTLMQRNETGRVYQLGFRFDLNK